jgi:hypothetical protein
MRTADAMAVTHHCIQITHLVDVEWHHFQKSRCALPFIAMAAAVGALHEPIKP